jgi:hypothetical protein
LESGEWRYRLFRDKAVVFAARSPSRRWSLDAADSDGVVRPSWPHYISIYHALAPTLPVLKADQDLRTNLLFYHKQIKPLWGTARFRYKSKDGGTHVFHQRKVLQRRVSLDMAPTERMALPWPHRARMYADVPLRMAPAAVHTEKERNKWYAEEMYRLSKEWRGQQPDDRSRSTSRPRFETRPWVKPPDIDHESMFSSSTRGASYIPRARNRRMSADDQSWAYRSGRNKVLSFLDRARRPSSSYYSYNSSSRSRSRSRRRGRRSISPMRSNLRTKILGFFKSLTAALINIICCCAPCAIVRDHAASRRRRRQFGTLQTTSMDLDANQQAYPVIPTRCMRCTRYDKDFASSARTRQVRRLVPEGYNSTSLQTYFSAARLKTIVNSAASRVCDGLWHTCDALLGIPSEEWEVE